MSESTGKKSKLKGCAEAIGVIGGILGIITSSIVIYQFVSGNMSVASLFHAISVPLLAPPPSVPILYNSLWTWLWWAGGGTLSGGLTGGIRNWVKYPALGFGWEEFFAGLLSGVIVGTLSGFLLSLLINFLHIPYGFPISIGVDCVLAIVASRILFA